jgi:hypothetical protein
MNHDQHRMECYDIADWWGHFSHGPCQPCTIRADDPDDQLTMDEELAAARQDYLDCLLLCETDYCKSICKREYDANVLAIRSRYE